MSAGKMKSWLLSKGYNLVGEDVYETLEKGVRITVDVTDIVHVTHQYNDVTRYTIYDMPWFRYRKVLKLPPDIKEEMRKDRESSNIITIQRQLIGLGFVGQVESDKVTYTCKDVVVTLRVFPVTDSWMMVLERGRHITSPCRVSSDSGQGAIDSFIKLIKYSLGEEKCKW